MFLMQALNNHWKKYSIICFLKNKLNMNTLATYSTRITSLLLLFNMMLNINASAQIIYTDVNPDTTVACSSAPCSHSNTIDLNNDGIADYTIAIYYNILNCFPSGTYSKKYVSVNSTGSNNLMLTMMNLNDKIGNNLVFNTTSGSLRSINFSLHYCAGSSGSWTSATDHYLGVRMVVGSNVYYGWIRLNVSVSSSSLFYTIKDYAYNSIPNQPILAGETSCIAPTVTIAKSGSLSFCAGDSVILTANGTGYLYQWKKNGVNISGATQQTYTVKSAGTYKCKVTNSCGSVTSGGKIVTVPCRNIDSSFLGMTSVELERISIFPNPATNSITIKLPSDEAGELHIANMLGETLTEFKTLSALTVDVSKFPAGMYVLQWHSGENFETKIFSIVK